MKKFFPIVQRSNGYYYNGFTGRKLVGMSIDRNGNFRFIIENNDHTYQKLLDCSDVKNLAIWLDVIYSSANDLINRDAFNGSHRLNFTNNICFVLEVNCSHPASSKYKLMLSVAYPGGSLLFNISKDTDFKNLKSVSSDLVQALDIIESNKGLFFLKEKSTSDDLLEMEDMFSEM